MSEPRQNFSQWAGVILSVLFLGLAVFLWPGFMGRVVPLDWKMGDMRPVAHGLQAIFGVLAILSFRNRSRLTTLWNRLFQDRKTFVFAVIGSLLALSITLAIMEIALRILDLPYRTSWTPQEYYRVQFDPEIGWVYVPNKSTVQQFVPGQPEVTVHSDRIGSRVAAPGVEHDPGAPSVLFVGGSFTYGFGLPYEETLTGRLESIPGFPYQVVNLGVEAYGTDQALLLLKRHFSRFDTKVVVYTFIGNHIERNINYDRRMLFRRGRFVGTKPLFGLADDGTLYLRKEARTYAELPEFRIWSLVQYLWTRWGPKPSLEDIAHVGATFTTDEQYRRAAALTMRFILDMNEFVESQGAEFIVFYWNFGEKSQKNPESSRGIVWPMLQEIDVDVIEISRAAPPDWGWKDYTIPGDGHPNAKANDFAAQLLFDELLHRGLSTNDSISSSR
jgi:hypothetical protein